MKKILTGLVAVLVMQCSLTAAVTVVADATDGFTVMAPPVDLTNWAITHGGTAGNFTTLQDTAAGDVYLSTTPNPSAVSTEVGDQQTGTLTIPFEFAKDIKTLTLHVASNASGSYDNNAARNMIYLTVNGTRTLIYQHDDVLRPASLGGYGGYIYGSATVPYTSWPDAQTIAYECDIDVSNLVVGATSFELEYYVMAGFSGYRYNGGGFYMSSSTSNPITLVSGTVYETSSPTFSPAGPYVACPVNVTISSATSGATIYYTTDGSDPTPSGTAYSNPTTVEVTDGMTLKAIAVANGNTSHMRSQTYFNANATAVMVSADENARFTVTAPPVDLTNWARANGGTASNFTTLQDTAFGDVYLSTTPNPSAASTEVGVQQTGTLTIPFEFAKDIKTLTLHVASNASGSYDNNAARNMIYLTVNGTRTLIYQHDDVLRPASLGGYGGYIYGSATVPYTSWPDAQTIAYECDIDVSNLVVGATSFELEYYVMAGFSGYRYNGGGFYMSSSTSNPITLVSGTVYETSSPTFSPAGPYMTSPTEVTISSATSGATIYYTTDGTDPTTSGTAYSNPTTVIATNGMTVKAIAVSNGRVSHMRSQTYLYPPVFTLDSKGRWLKDGEPFVPLVMYLATNYYACGQAGFNTVVIQQAGDPDNLDYCIEQMNIAHENGLGVWCHVCEYFRNKTDYDGLRAVVTALKDHPAMEAWYLADEPSNESISPSVLQNAKAIIHELDPKHPVIGLDNVPSHFADYAPAFDAFMSDPYPIPDHDISMVTSWIDTTRAALSRGQSLMVCLQTQGQPYYDRGPTSDEIWNMAYQAVVDGVQGIGWWCNATAEENGHWADYQALLPVLQSVMPYTVSSDTRTAYSGSGIYAAVFDGEAGRVLVAVNTSSSSQALTISIGASEAAAIGSARNATLTVGSSSSQLAMDGLGCGAWLLTIERIPGDANGDNKVDVSDLGILAANYGMTGGATWDKGDFNHDGKVDVSDLGILAANYGTGTGAALDFNTDAQSLGLATEAANVETPVSSTLGCGSMGLPLIAGLFLMGLFLIKLDE